MKAKKKIIKLIQSKLVSKSRSQESKIQALIVLRDEDQLYIPFIFSFVQYKHKCSEQAIEQAHLVYFIQLDGPSYVLSSYSRERPQRAKIEHRLLSFESR